MVSIRAQDGTDLVANPPADRALAATNNRAVYSLQALIVEDDTTLPTQAVAGTIFWNDGGPATVVNGSGTVSVDVAHSFSPGTYLVTLAARNFGLAASASQASVTYGIQVKANALAQERPVVYGPILPRDQGFPGPKDWNLDTASNLFILESSVKMLLTTAKGERIMQPTYGTAIRSFVFDTNDGSLDASLQREITEALAVWEPRVELQFLQVTRSANERTATVVCSLASRLTGEAFSTTLYFQR
jgi:phage baseplate assembly protein W